MKFVFDIEPVAQARPRATRFGKSIRLYDPKAVKVYKQSLAYLAQNAYHGKPLSGPLRVILRFYWSIQRSVSKKEHTRRDNGQIRPTVKADVTNYAKSTEDALNGILWKDDAMIVDEFIYKYYSDHPRVEIEVIEIGEA